MNEDINPYAPPASEIQPLEVDPLSTWKILAEAWALYRTHFLMIAIIVTIVSIPSELLMSFLIESSSLNLLVLSFATNIFLGVIDTAGVISMLQGRQSGQHIGVDHALARSLECWPRMWWTRALTVLIAIFSLALLVVPFFVIYPRIALAEYCVVTEGLSGPAAIRRSFELTRGSYWALHRLFLIYFLLLIGVSFLVMTLKTYIVSIHSVAWDTAIHTLCTILMTYTTVTLYCAHQTCLSRFQKQSSQA